MPRIFYFSPYSTTGSLGEAYNAHAALLPDDNDWAIFTDIDVMFFSSQLLGQQVEEAIKAHPEMQVFTCVTTRLCQRCQQQVQEPGIRAEQDLVKLKREADRRLRQYRGHIEPIKGFFAGFFMVFQKKLWKRFPFPTIGSQGGKFLGVDSAWARTLRENRIKVGMMKGLLAVHFYRLDTGEANISHLPDPGHNQKIINPWERHQTPAPLNFVEKQYLIPGRPLKIELNPSLRPPGGYRFRDTDGNTHDSTSLDKLVGVVSAYRKRIGREVGDPRQEILEQIYARFPRCCIITR